MKFAKKIAIYIIVTFLVIYTIAQNSKNDFINLCGTKIAKQANSPLNRLDLSLRSEAIENCSPKDEHVLSLNNQDNFYYDKYNSKPEKTWLSAAIVKDLWGKKNLSHWIGYLAIANAKSDYITHNDKNDYVLLGCQNSRSEYSTWSIFVNGDLPEKSQSLNEWNLLNLADKDFNFRFAKLLADDPSKYKISHIEDIITWGLKERNSFKSLTIRAVLKGNCLNSAQTNLSQKNLNTIDLKEAFVLQNGRPKCVDEIFSSGIEENNPLSYLIETDKGWYAWEGDSANKEGYEPYQMKVVEDEENDLRTNPDEAWFRLKNYQAILLENINGYKTYVNKATNDIYCIKSETNNRILYQPMNIRGDSSAGAKKIKQSLNNLTRANYHQNKLIRKVIEYWIKNDKDHYVVHLNENISGIIITQKDIEDFPLVTINNEFGDKSAKGICLYGWLENDNPEPKFLRCNFCKYLSFSDTARSALFGSSSRILGVKKISDTTWNICLITYNQPDYDLSIFEIDTTNENRTTKSISNPLDKIFGSDKNNQETKNKYLQRIWIKVAAKPGYSFPPEGNCDEWVIGGDTIDNFLRTRIVEPLLKNESTPIIRQILPECIENSNDESPEKVLLHNEDKIKADSFFIPACFKKENTQQGKWKYLVEEGNILKRYFSNSSFDEVPWINEEGIRELKSAWLSWLALANNKVKVVSKLCDSTPNTDSIRVCIILSSAGSLYSWLGRSSNFVMPVQTKMIASDRYLFLRPSVRNTDYLAVLYNQIVTPQEKEFYCIKADSVDFTIADHFGSPENGRCVLYHTNDDKEYKVNCISNISNVDKRKIYFVDVLKEKTPWKLVCSVYNTNKFRKVFDDEVALYSGSVNMINTYWGSSDKFGINRGEEVGVFTKSDGMNTLKKYRFGFINPHKIMSLVSSEYYYETFSAKNPGEISNYFYSWINDDYRKGKANSLFWRANPLGYFDRLNSQSDKKSNLKNSSILK